MTTTGPLRPYEARNHDGALEGSNDPVSDHGPTRNSTLGSETIDAIVTLPTREFGERPVQVKRAGDRIEYVSDEVRVWAPEPKPWWKVFGKDTYEPLVHEIGAEMTPRDRAAVQVLFLAGAFSNFLREKLGIANIAEATGGGDVILAALGKQKRTFWSNEHSRACFGSGNGHFEVSPEAFAHEYTHGLLRHIGVSNIVAHEGVADSMAEYFCYWLAHEHEEAARYFDWKSLSHGGYSSHTVRSFDREGATNDVRTAVRTDCDPHKSSGAVRMLFFGLVHDLAGSAEPYSTVYDDAMDRAFTTLLEAVKSIKDEPEMLEKLPAALLERAAPELADPEAFRRDYADPAREQIRELELAQVFNRGLM